MKILKYAVVLSTLAIFSGALAAKPVVVTDLSKPIVLSNKQSTVSFRLKANRTTGFSWVLASYNHDLLVPKSAKYLPPISQLVGAPGYVEWTFKVKRSAYRVPQQTDIVLRYRRLWDSSIGEKRVVTVIFHHS